MAERGQVGTFIIILVALAIIGAFAVCAWVVPGDGDDHSLGRREVAARSHDHDGDEDKGDGEVNYFSPQIDKLVICLPGSTCPQA